MTGIYDGLRGASRGGLDNRTDESRFPGRSVMAKFGMLATIVLVIVAAGCDAKHEVSPSTEEAAIRRTDADWLAASSSHDLERVLPFWSDDATILAPGTPPIIGKDAIRKYVSEAFATPGFSITWKTEKVEVSKAGDLETSTFSVFQVIENPGVANASETYLRIASLPMIGGVPGARIVASSDQNGSTRSRSCEEEAASQSASVRRIAASSVEGLTSCFASHPAATITSTIVASIPNLAMTDLPGNRDSSVRLSRPPRDAPRSPSYIPVIQFGSAGETQRIHNSDGCRVCRSS